MADWFKLYENWYHEPRLQWAIQKDPHVITVWLWCLTECCRRKSSIISLPRSGAEMIGIQQMTGISPGIFNSCINVLEEIMYIRKDEDSKLFIFGWKTHQSKYLTNKDRKKNKQNMDESATEYHKVPQNGTVCHTVPQSTARGEEKRERLASKKQRLSVGSDERLQ